MSIITLRPKQIKAYKSYDETEVGDTATKVIGLWEFVVRPHDIDKSRQGFRCSLNIEKTLTKHILSAILVYDRNSYIRGIIDEKNSVTVDWHLSLVGIHISGCCIRA